jgi:phosphopantothenoylcysteine synthetase/decarboxylase
MNVLITAGGTRVPIDNVRHIGNMSSGAYGSLLAYEFYVMNHSNITYFIDKHSPHSNDYNSEDKSRRVKTIKRDCQGLNTEREVRCYHFYRCCLRLYRR